MSFQIDLDRLSPGGHGRNPEIPDLLERALPFVRRAWEEHLEGGPWAKRRTTYRSGALVAFTSIG